MDSGNGCTMRMYLLVLNSTLKNGKFYVYLQITTSRKKLKKKKGPQEAKEGCMVLEDVLEDAAPPTTPASGLGPTAPVPGTQLAVEMRCAGSGVTCQAGPPGEPPDVPPLRRDASAPAAGRPSPRSAAGLPRGR